MPLMIGLNGGCVDVVLRMVSIILVLWGFGTVLGNEYGIQGQNHVALLQGSEITTEISPHFHYRNWNWNLDIKSFVHSGLMVRQSMFQFSSPRSFSGGGEHGFTFKS